ncbi:MAG: biotin/lipoyl-containing protein, partial [Chloroflexota bacterium]
MIKSEVLVPLLNANEPEARLVGIHVKDGQAVEKGTLLFTLETTKAASEIESPEAGFVRILAKDDDTLAVGDVLAYVTDAVDEPLPQASEIHPSSFIPHPSELRITKPARALAESLGIDFSSLPANGLVTEAIVRQFAAPASLPDLPISQSTHPQLLIYGGGGHAIAVMEMAQALGAFHVAGIIDDKIPAGTEVLGIPVLGTRAVLPQVVAQGVRLAANGVGGIIDINIRVQVFELLEHFGFDFPSLLHPRATLEPSAEVGEGVQV